VPYFFHSKENINEGLKLNFLLFIDLIKKHQMGLSATSFFFAAVFSSFCFNTYYFECLQLLEHDSRGLFHGLLLFDYYDQISIIQKIKKIIDFSANFS